MSLSMPTDAVASQPNAHVDVNAKSSTKSSFTRNNELESLRHNGNDEDDSDYPEGGAEAWLVVLGAWCAMMYVQEIVFRTHEAC
jgi:hypothetical protein